jgi:ABC-type polysaccharide/polyol phosphate transport system ATPase subunit
MSAVIFEGVSKKFRRGERHDSLRDLVPALFNRAFHGAPDRQALADQEFWAVRDLSFTVGAGEALGIIGPNGAGKSTTLKLLTKILRPTRGRIEINGRVGALIEVAAGFHPDLTGRENVYLQGAIMGMSRGEIARKFDAIVDFSGVQEFIDTPVKRYSSGMNARLGFAIAAHLDPDVLIIDEVLSVGDVGFQEKCVTRMRELLARGIPLRRRAVRRPTGRSGRRVPQGAPRADGGRRGRPRQADGDHRRAAAAGRRRAVAAVHDRPADDHPRRVSRASADPPAARGDRHPRRGRRLLRRHQHAHGRLCARHPGRPRFCRSGD